MRILYLMTTYSPRDNNQNYFRDNGYVYRAIDAIVAAKNHTKHDLDFYVVDCASGPQTREAMLSYRSRKGMNIGFVFGPDLSGSICINTSCKRLNSKFSYDYMMFSASDAVLQNPDRLDKVINNLNKSENCDFAYLNAQPGLELPKQTLDVNWFKSMSMHESVHYNAFCVKGKFLKFYDNRVIMDALIGAAEAFMGYYCHASGSWRKIAKLNYLHLPKTGVRTDRKTAYTNKNLCRGDGFYLVPSEYTTRSFEAALRSDEAVQAGIFFERPGQPIVNKDNMLDETSRLRLAKFVKKHFLLTRAEFDYDHVPMQIL